MRYTDEQIEKMLEANLVAMKMIKESGLFKEIPLSIHNASWAMESMLAGKSIDTKWDERASKFLSDRDIEAWKDL